jgi:hypothetical protein
VRHGAHRAGRNIAAALMPSLLAVAAVVSLVTALAVWQGEDAGQPGAAASTTSASASATSAPATSTTTTPSPTPSADPSTETAAEPSTESTVEEASGLEVVVLNQSVRGGLAGSVADTLREAGWEVPAVGNFRGVVPATTVYYPDGAEGDAQDVAADLPTEPRVRPRFGNLSTSRLTVVVTSTYPG